MTYTEEQVKEIIKTNLDLKERVLRLEKELSECKDKAQITENAYNSLTKRCTEMYLSTEGIITELFNVQVRIPAFMSNNDVLVAITQQVQSFVVAERLKHSVFPEIEVRDE